MSEFTSSLCRLTPLWGASGVGVHHAERKSLLRNTPTDARADVGSHRDTIVGDLYGQTGQRGRRMQRGMSAFGFPSRKSLAHNWKSPTSCQHPTPTTLGSQSHDSDGVRIWRAVECIYAYSAGGAWRDSDSDSDSGSERGP